MTAKYFVQAIVVCCLSVDLVLSLAVVKLRLVRLENSNGHSADGLCCDLFCSSACDHFLQICLDVPNGNDALTSCAYRFHETDHWHNQNTVTFGTSLSQPQAGLELANPFTTDVQNWKGGFTLKVKVFDADNIVHDFVDSMMQTFHVSAPANGVPSSTYSTTILGANTNLLVEYSAWCGRHYYGASCNTRCEPNEGGHYNCSKSGQKICSEGYEGENCNILSDDCINHECRNEAMCVDGDRVYTCSCLAGFTGNRCEININECSSSPCHNGGECVNGVSSYTCECVSGFVGPTCAEHICSSDITSPCQNNGTCFGTGQCLCQENFIGDHCETDSCANITCLNGGSCEYGNCSCALGFTGDQCETNVDDCAGDVCQNGGDCRDAVNAYTCNCSKGYYGTHCEHFNACSSAPCVNGGTCLSGGTDYQCICVAGYRGVSCEVNEITTTNKLTAADLFTVTFPTTTSSAAVGQNESVEAFAAEHIGKPFYWEPLLSIIVLLAAVVSGIIIGVLLKRRRNKAPPSPPPDPRNLNNFDNPVYTTGATHNTDDEPIPRALFSNTLPDCFLSLEGATCTASVDNEYDIKGPLPSVTNSNIYDTPKAREVSCQGAEGGLPLAPHYAVPRSLKAGPLLPPPYEEIPSSGYQNVNFGIDNPGYGVTPDGATASEPVYEDMRTIKGDAERTTEVEEKDG